MLSHVQMLETFADMWPKRLITPTPQDTGLYVFPNNTTGALMAVEYPLAVEQRVKSLLVGAHADRDYGHPSRTLSASEAASKIGISRSTLRRWVAKGWIYNWAQWGFWGSYKVPSLLFTEQEVEAYCLAKPRAL